MRLSVPLPSPRRETEVEMEKKNERHDQQTQCIDKQIAQPVQPLPCAGHEAAKDYAGDKRHQDLEIQRKLLHMLRLWRGFATCGP